MAQKNQEVKTNPKEVKKNNGASNNDTTVKPERFETESTTAEERGGKKGIKDKGSK